MTSITGVLSFVDIGTGEYYLTDSSGKKHRVLIAAYSTELSDYMQAESRKTSTVTLECATPTEDLVTAGGFSDPVLLVYGTKEE